VPSGLNATPETPSVWPVRVRMCSPGHLRAILWCEKCYGTQSCGVIAIAVFQIVAAVVFLKHSPLVSLPYVKCGLVLYISRLPLPPHRAALQCIGLAPLLAKVMALQVTS